MRREFAPLLYERMLADDRIWLITADLGYGMFDKIRDKFPDRFINCGAAEQLMLGLGIGLAESGKIPICYSITPFLICRPFELIRNYINHENVPVKLLGGGRDDDYAHDGFSHFAFDHKDIINLFPNIEKFIPETIKEMEVQFSEFLYNSKPSYLNLKR